MAKRHLVVVLGVDTVSGRIGPDTEDGRVVPLTAAEPYGRPSAIGLPTRTQINALSDIVTWGVRFGAETFEVLR